MIDTVMHKEMFPDAYEQSEHDEIIEDSILPVNPSNDFFLLLPPTISGYSMQVKRWVTLKVVHIEPVFWNLEAFDSLVVDADTKTLVKALVTNQLAKESVAELAKKPLYRVTCGDIGTNADAIDKEDYGVVIGEFQKIGISVLNRYLVVLLDEADVFLEERSLADMQRNALVSVFLSVLEYYDGILVLTSNRVGTFDEAFKSRIQLSLHYENLTRTQRRAMWDNFFKRLEKIEPDTVDTSSLYRHLDELAARDMNGRQIRNSITTARQLAMYQEKKMDYAVLKHVIGVASKFDQCVKSVKHGITDDELAREGGVR